jgi:hypothetical protein
VPYEALTCPKCGSGDCQEVKPGTQFCNHCDNVFKYIPSTAAGGGVAACSTCGVIAVGLCNGCERYFCSGHQAWKDTSTWYVNLCTACLKDKNDEQTAKAAQAATEALRRSHQCGSIYIAESAHSELMAARIPQVKLYGVGPHVVKPFMRSRGRRTIQNHNFGQVGKGWLLDDFYWEKESWSRVGPATGKYQTVFFAEFTGLPASSVTLKSFTAKSHFGRVTGKTDDGYGVAYEPGHLNASYEQLGEAIQRLAGTTEQHR